jgi:hypothetical protein
MILGIVKTIIGTKQVARLNPGDLQMLAVVIVEAFLGSLTIAMDTNWMPNIRFLSILGTVKESQCVPGIFLDFSLPVEWPSSGTDNMDVGFCIGH